MPALSVSSPFFFFFTHPSTLHPTLGNGPIVLLIFPFILRASQEGLCSFIAPLRLPSRTHQSLLRLRLTLSSCTFVSNSCVLHFFADHSPFLSDFITASPSSSLHRCVSLHSFPALLLFALHSSHTLLHSGSPAPPKRTLHNPT